MMVRVFLALYAFLLLDTVPAFAIPSDKPSAESDRDEYDFSWLDPDKKIYVVQNRKFTKAEHFEASVSAGVGMGETYRSQRQWNVRGTFYFSEHWAVTGFLLNNMNSENDVFTQLRSVSSVVPTVRDTNQYFGGSVMWLPFYGKINMFNQIFYMDWDFEAGVGSAQTEIDLNTSASGTAKITTGTYGAFHYGTGWKFFITRHLGARLDYLSTHYKAPNGLKGSIDGSDSQNYSNNYLTIGLSYLL